MRAFSLLIGWLVLAHATAYAGRSFVGSCREEVEARALPSGYLTDPDSIRHERYAFYATNLTSRTPAELAEYFGVSEYTVHADLQRLGLSLVGALERTFVREHIAGYRLRLGWIGKSHLARHLVPEMSVSNQIRILADEGLTDEELGRVFGLRPAVIALVADRRKGEGREWDRVLSHAGLPCREADLVLTLHDEGLEPAEIADHLNREGKRLSSRRILRTPQEVEQRLDRTRARLGHAVPSDGVVFRPRYGFLKRNGSLETEPVMRFLLDHYYKNDAWLASQLGVTLPGLSSFYFDHALYRARRSEGLFEVGPTNPKHTAWNAYQARRLVVDAVLDWMLRFPGRHPQASDFGTGEEKVGIPYAKARGAFSSMEGLWLAVKKRSLERAIPFALHQVKRVDDPDLLREAWQIEAVDLVVDWIVRHEGRMPSPDDFAAEPTEEVRDVVPLDYARFTGTGTYRLGRAGRQRPKRFFDSPEMAWLMVKIRALQRGVRCHPFLGVYFQSPGDVVRRERQAEAPDLVIDWMIDSGRYPRDGDFGMDPGQPPITAAQLYGTGEYRPGHINHAGRIFDSRAMGLRRVRERVTSRQLEGLVPDVPGDSGDPTIVTQTP